MHGTSYFSCLDLRSGYWQVEVDDHSKLKTAFATHSGLYEFRRMPFGLANAPSTFQRFMHAVLRGLQYQICLVHLDDIIVYSRSFADHINHLNDVFSRLRSANVKLKPSKCSFARSSVEYLGHVVSRDGIRPDPSKIAAVATFPVPRCVRDVRSFLGLANYYHRFIHNFAFIASPLHMLTHKNVRFYWDDSCDKAFHILKSCLTSAPILAYPDFFLPFELNTDASSTGIGFALCQTQDGQRRAIAYGGRDLNTAERNYSTTEREALAIVEGIKKFRNYLYDRKFVLHTDHHALRWLMSLKDPSGRLARWSLLLQQYDFTIEYKPGKPNSDADALSRRPYGAQFHVSAYDLPGAFDRLAVDCLGLFPLSNAENRYVVVFTEYLTRWPEAFAVPNTDARTIARLLVNRIVLTHSAPRTLLFDRGKNFLSSLVRSVCELLNTKKVNTTAYHPQTDGLVERFNHTLCQSVSMYVSRDQKDWDTHLPAILFGFRVSPHETTGDSPFYLLYGREPRLPVDVSLLPPSQVSNFVREHRARIVQTSEEAHAIARKNIQRTQQNMKDRHDRSARDSNLCLEIECECTHPKHRKVCHAS